MNDNASQRHRINRVINYMRLHGSQQISLDQLADVACLSRFHFLRTFRAHCNETPFDFLNRTRLEKSVSDLVSKRDTSLTNIALDAGFSSSQAFSHAFKRRYNIAPRQYRKDNLWGTIGFANKGIGHPPLTCSIQAEMDSMMHSWSPSLRTMPEMRLAYVRHRGPHINPQNGAPAIRASFDGLVAWAKNRGVWHQHSSVLGLCVDNPSATPPIFAQYDVCIPVDETVSEDDIVSIQHRPTATIIALEVAPQGTTALMDAWRWLINDWVPQMGLDMDLHAAFELYQTEKGRLLTLKEGVTLCIPIVMETLTV